MLLNVQPNSIQTFNIKLIRSHYLQKASILGVVCSAKKKRESSIRL